MVRKISILLISVAILATGIAGFLRLGYWNRSVRIFSYSQSGSSNGRPGRDFREGYRESGDFHGFEGREMQGLRPSERDSMRSGLKAEGREDFRNRPLTPDSLRQISRGNFERGRRGDGEGRFGRGGGHGREGFRRGGSINLGGVSWFLAVFAAFALITIYLDKWINQWKKWRKSVKN